MRYESRFAVASTLKAGDLLWCAEERCFREVMGTMETYAGENLGEKILTVALSFGAPVVLNPRIPVDYLKRMP